MKICSFRSGFAYSHHLSGFSISSKSNVSGDSSSLVVPSSWCRRLFCKGCAHRLAFIAKPDTALQEFGIAQVPTLISLSIWLFSVGLGFGSTVLSRPNRSGLSLTTVSAEAAYICTLNVLPRFTQMFDAVIWAQQSAYLQNLAEVYSVARSPPGSWRKLYHYCLNFRILCHNNAWTAAQKQATIITSNLLV